MKPTLLTLGLFVVTSAGCPGSDSSSSAPEGGNDAGMAGTGASTDSGTGGSSENGSTQSPPATGGGIGGGTGGTSAIASTAAGPGAGGNGGSSVSGSSTVTPGTGGSGVRGTGGSVGGGTGNPVDWNTPFVTLHADDFRIEVAGKIFLGNAVDATLHSDPGTANEYTTFEREWTENGVPMRLYIYFDGNGRTGTWSASEIRIYDGSPEGDWLESTSSRFKTPLGQAFTGDLDLTLPGSNPGRLVMRGLRLQAFITPQACLDNTSGAPYVVEVLYPTIEMTTDPGSGFGVNVRLRDSNCQPVANPSAFVFVWSVDDPTIVALSRIIPDSSNVQLKGLAAGVTTLRVAAQRSSDGVVVAQATMAVTVTAAPWGTP